MFEKLFKDIAKPDSDIVVVDLSNNKLSIEDINGFNQALNSNKSVKLLYVENCNLTDEKLDALALGIEQSSAPIISVKFENNVGITDKGRLRINRALHSRLIKFRDGRFDGIKMSAVHECIVKTPKSKDKTIVLMLGVTGSGKSTIINYLLGSKFDMNDEGQLIAVPEYAKMGHTMNSETFWPSVYQGAESKYAYCDTPGLEGTRGKQELMLNAINMKNAVKSALQTKTIIVVIDYNTLNVDKGNSLRKVLKTITHQLGDPENCKDSLYFAFNKVPQSTNPKLAIKKEHIINKLSQMREGIERIEGYDSDSEQVNLHSMICLLLNNKNNMLILDPLDNGETRNELKQLIDKSPGIPLTSFRFSESEETEIKVQAYVEGIMQIGLQMGEYWFSQEVLVNKYPLDIKEIEEERQRKSDLLINHNIQKTNLEKQNLVDIQSLEQAERQLLKTIEENKLTINQKKERIASLNLCIKANQDILKEYDTNEVIVFKNVEITLSSQLVSGPYRKKQGKNLLGKTKYSAQEFMICAPKSHKFEFSGSLYDKCEYEHNGRGRFFEEKHNQEQTMCEVKFETVPSGGELVYSGILPCIATFKVYGKKKNLAENVIKIRNAKHEIALCGSEIESLNKIINSIEESNEKLNTAYKERQQLKNNEKSYHKKLLDDLISQISELDNKIKDLSAQKNICDANLTAAKLRLTAVQQLFLDIDNDIYDTSKNPPIIDKPACFKTVVKLAQLLELAKKSNLISTFITQYQKLNQINKSIESKQETPQIAAIASTFSILSPPRAVAKEGTTATQQSQQSQNTLKV